MNGANATPMSAAPFFPLSPFITQPREVSPSRGAALGGISGGTMTRHTWQERKLTIPMRLTREQYEAECLRWGVLAHPDSDMGSYGDLYGDYWGGAYDAMTDAEVAYLGDGRTAEQARLSGIESLLRQRRWAVVKAERPEVLAGAGAAASRRVERYRCRECGVSGNGGQRPFSTRPGSGYCDDCGA